MTSPFVYEKPVRPDDLIDRADELETLTGRALDARNSRLEGPRRFGKTSLLRAVLGAAERRGAIPIEVGFLGCVTAADVAERIERAYGAQLDSGLRRWFEGLVRTLRPTISATPGGVGVRAELQVSSPGLLDRLDLPRRVFERTGRPCAIAFDEFQEVVRISPALPGVFRTQLEGHADEASYIFSGSHPGLMTELFADRRHAFFAQAAPVFVGPLPADALADSIVSRFRTHRRDPGDALGPLLDAAEGHPQRAMLLAHHLFARTARSTPASIEAWLDAYAGARREAESEIQVLWASCSQLERRLLKLIAFRTVALNSNEAHQRFGVSKGSSVGRATRRLTAEGHLIEDDTSRSGLRIVDPFLSAWLRENEDSD